MFTGIISSVGRIAAVRETDGADLQVTIDAGQPLDDVALGASIACSGVCLTVTRIDGPRFTVSISGESVARTVPGMWREGQALNLERALRVGDELGGHIVTGHVDGVGEVRSVETVDGSRHIVIAVSAALAPLVAGKGSIAVDGVSLTVNAVEDKPDGTVFHVNIIPHTATETTLADLTEGTKVNLEVDILARYLSRLEQARTA